jgi:GrpB-like predicted nucleotidyltransferase (UPF0157 family)
MKKELSEMTQEELWELFPIILREPNTEYKKWYEIEKQRLLRCIDKTNIMRINHIGSTAVEGLLSKPTIDILLEVDKQCDMQQLVNILAYDNWLVMSSSPKSLVLNKGYTKDGFAEKVYHLHIRYYDNWNELYFRDYLREHKAVADEYGKLKLKLLEKYKHDRDGYTNAKSEFILKYTKKAKAKYGDKYSTHKQFENKKEIVRI